MISRSRRTAPFFLLGMLLIAWSALQFWRLTYVTLWSDETNGTLQMIRHPWSALLVGDYTWEFNPPFYFLLLKGWTSLLGEREATMRLLSLLLSAGSLMCAAFLGKKLGNWAAGMAAMAILAFHPIYLAYSTQLRMYPLLIFLSLLAFAAYAASTRNPHRARPWLAIMGAAVVLAQYTHYLGGLVGVSLLIFALSYRYFEKDRTQVPVLRALLVSALLCLPVLPLAFTQYTRYVEKASDLSLVFNPLPGASILAIFSGSLSFDFRASDVPQILSLLAVLGGGVVLIYQRKRALAAALVSCIGLSAAVVIGLSLSGINVDPRYVIHVAILSWLLACLSLAFTKAWYGKLAALVCIAAITVYGFNGVRDAILKEYFAPNWRQVAAILSQEALPGEPIVIMGWDANPAGYYLDRPWLNSYDFERHLSQDSAHSYLILDSQYARKLDFVDLSAGVIFSDPRWSVRVVRYQPQEPGS